MKGCFKECDPLWGATFFQDVREEYLRICYSEDCEARIFAKVRNEKSEPGVLRSRLHPIEYRADCDCTGSCLIIMTGAGSAAIVRDAERPAVCVKEFEVKYRAE